MLGHADKQVPLDKLYWFIQVKHTDEDEHVAHGEEHYVHMFNPFYIVFLKYPVGQLLTQDVPDRYNPALQERQVVLKVTQVKQLVSQTVHLLLPIKYPSRQVKH